MTTYTPNQSSKGDSDKPLTSEELDALERELCLEYEPAAQIGKDVRRLLSMARSSLAGEVPAGMKLVPVEPTPEMLAAAQEAFPRSASFVFPKLYEAMLSSAPDALSEGEAGEVAEEAMCSAYDAGYNDGFVDGYCAGAETDPPEDEATLHRHIDTTARAEGWQNNRAALLAKLPTTPTTGPGQELVEAAKALLEADKEHVGLASAEWDNYTARLRTAIANTQGG